VSEDARHHFLAWARQGIASTLTNPDYGGSLPARGALEVTLNVKGQGPDSTTPIKPVAVQTFGPGDVLGIDPRHVVRTEPKDSTTNFEPNYLAGIEFDTPDFPWLFTPAAPAGDRLRPWIALVVLANTEFEPANGVVSPLPAIDVTSLAALQPLDDAWNWAHTQVSGDAGLAATVAASPASVISRLLCPRRLEPETAYTAFVVPAFEAGRLAGLGTDVTALTTDPAWTLHTNAPLRLPVLYQFRFHTSDQGDFESLVRRLVPRKLGASIGQRPMAVDEPMPNIPSAGAPLMLEGALRSIVTVPTQWAEPDKAQFQDTVQSLVNRTQPLIDNPAEPDPQVVPPIYGRWPAGVNSVSPASSGWLDELGLDPRNRTAGGMGTQVVQGQQTALLASAWQQVAGIDAANAALRRAQLARASMTMLHDQLSGALDATVLAVTAPLHAKLLASPITVRSVIDASRVPLRLLSPAARRLTHPTSLIRRRQRALAGQRATIGSLLERVNAGTVTVVPPPSPPGGLVPIESIGGGDASPLGKWFPIVLTATTPVGSFTATIDVDEPSTSIATSPVALTVADVAAIPPRPDFMVTSPETKLTAASATATGADSPEGALLREALGSIAEAWAEAAPDPPMSPPVEVAALRTSILSRLEPAATVPARTLSLVRISANLDWQPADPLREIMAAPSFPQPMYEPLRDLSEQYVLPGADEIPADTVGLLETNHAFIEGYMVGLSHELARQLLFAGYPTDCMGTYFRQFWDVSKYVPQPGDPTDPAQLAELLKDIPPIVTWPLEDGLGKHENRTGVVANNLVLIIRGELLRRYPDAIIYAAKAKLEGRRRVIDPTVESHPIFAGTLSADMNFLGFNLSAVDAKGGTADAPQGYFFVFQQHPSGPRFGLEPSASETVTQWADLAWSNFSAAPPAESSAPSSKAKLVGPWTELRLASSTFAEVLAQRPAPPFLSAALPPSGVGVTGGDAANQWGRDAAQTAYITARLPFRVAIHADLMVP